MQLQQKESNLDGNSLRKITSEDLQSLAGRLDEAIASVGGGAVVVKMSDRSPKDAVFVGGRIEAKLRDQFYQQQPRTLPTVYRAMMGAMVCRTGLECLALLMDSVRIWEDVSKRFEMLDQQQYPGSSSFAFESLSLFLIQWLNIAHLHVVPTSNSTLLHSTFGTAKSLRLWSIIVNMLQRSKNYGMLPLPHWLRFTMLLL